ncbi:NAD-dependent 4,6-dehydratase LegB [Paenibacillus pinihumi]|uniref:NAD-dependent 4,6-dehydratase LegB n=1 Tax=Paenibacillus pinihumi TaxID=669462 RepID=UPI000417725E|nr:NAD-dependent 4,6-dehydratase LegB [Paenibacillus pinihumi]
MNLAGCKALVTGADGFIGSHLVEELVRNGCEVKALVYYNAFGYTGWLSRLPDEIKSQIELISGDIRDASAVKQAMRGCGLVMHLAALVGIPYSYQAPESYIDTNVKGTLNILQAAREIGIAKLVHTSTSEVYGTARFVPITEEHPLLGQSPYAASKIGADQLALSFYHSYDTPVSVIRPFNTYGPRQSLRAVIPTVISQIASGTRHIRLGSLHPTRDFTFVKDTVRGFAAVAASPESAGQVIQIGSGYEISIGRTAALIAEVMGAEIEIEADEARFRPAKSEVGRLWADTSKAHTLLGWQPGYTGEEGFKRGLAETVRWFAADQSARHANPQAYTI